MQREIETLNEKIKMVRDKMAETRLDAVLSVDENNRNKKLEEYKKLKKEISSLMFERTAKLGGLDNDKYKGK